MALANGDYPQLVQYAAGGRLVDLCQDIVVDKTGLLDKIGPEDYPLTACSTASVFFGSLPMFWDDPIQPEGEIQVIKTVNIKIVLEKKPAPKLVPVQPKSRFALLEIGDD